MSIEPRAVSDSVLATGMVAAPAWASWLGDLNQALTTLTLVVGLVLGIVRLAQLLRNRNGKAS